MLVMSSMENPSNLATGHGPEAPGASMNVPVFGVGKDDLV
jgi:hypothetical protein